MALNIVEKIDGPVSIRRVLVSVWDKTGLPDFVRGIADINPNVKFYSTGGTYQQIRSLLGQDSVGRNLIAVSDYTGQPEMQGGLVKTLDFKIYLGLLSETYNPAHEADIARVNGVEFDMVVVNLYPFAQAAGKPDATPETARTNIDIGGPCMVRAAAKNYLRVASVTDPKDYPALLDELQTSRGSISLATRFRLAAKAFQTTAQYDKAISDYLVSRSFPEIEKTYKVTRYV